MNGVSNQPSWSSNPLPSSFQPPQNGLQPQSLDQWSFFNQNNTLNPAANAPPPPLPIPSFQPPPQQQQTPQPLGGPAPGIGWEQVQAWYRLVEQKILTVEQVELLIHNQTTQGSPPAPLAPNDVQTPSPSNSSNTVGSPASFPKLPNSSQAQPPHHLQPPQQQAPLGLNFGAAPTPAPSDNSSPPFSMFNNPSFFSPSPIPSTPAPLLPSASIPAGLQASLAAAARASAAQPYQPQQQQQSQQSQPHAPQPSASSTASSAAGSPPNAAGAPTPGPSTAAAKKRKDSAGADKDKDKESGARPTVKLSKAKAGASTAKGKGKKEKSATQLLAEGAPGMPSLAQLQAQLKPEQFSSSLATVMRKKGVEINEPYLIDGQHVPLYDLYQAVMVQGQGYENVDQTQSWDRICLFLSHPTSNSFPIKLATLYHKILAPYEDIWSAALLKQREVMINSSAGGGSSKNSDSGAEDSERRASGANGGTGVAGGASSESLPRLGLRFSEPANGAGPRRITSTPPQPTFLPFPSTSLLSSGSMLGTNDEARFEELPASSEPSSKRGKSAADGKKANGAAARSQGSTVASTSSSQLPDVPTLLAAGGRKKRGRENDDLVIGMDSSNAGVPGLAVDEVAEDFYRTAGLGAMVPNGGSSSGSSTATAATAISNPVSFDFTNPSNAPPYPSPGTMNDLASGSVGTAFGGAFSGFEDYSQLSGMNGDFSTSMWSPQNPLEGNEIWNSFATDGDGTATDYSQFNFGWPSQ